MEGTQRMLTLELRILEEHGVISRTVFDGVPPPVEYSLTARGAELSPIMDAMTIWGSARLDRAARQTGIAAGVTA